MTVEAIVPLAGSCPHRRRACQFCEATYSWPVTEAHSAAEGPWCKARVVMPAVEASAAEVIVVADADVMCDGVGAAVAAVEAGAAWSLPHTLIHRLDEQGTAAVLAGEDWRGQPLTQRPYRGVQGGGIVVARREVMLSIPLDCRFVGWGLPAKRTRRGRWRCTTSAALRGGAPPT